MGYNSVSEKYVILRKLRFISRNAPVPVVYFSHLHLKSARSSLVRSSVESLDSDPGEHFFCSHRLLHITGHAGAGVMCGTELRVVWFGWTLLGFDLAVFRFQRYSTPFIAKTLPCAITLGLTIIPRLFCVPFLAELLHFRSSFKCSLCSWLGWEIHSFNKWLILSWIRRLNM